MSQRMSSRMAPRMARRQSQTGFELSATGRLRHWAWLSVLGAGAVAMPAQAARFGSSDWWSQAGTASSPTTAAANAGSGTPAGLPAPVDPSAAKIQADRSLRNLSNAIAAMTSAVQAQQAAAAQALKQPSTVTDGLGVGGLQISDGAAKQQSTTSGCAQSGQCDWVNATLPTETVSGGQHTVTVTQNASKAILSWNSFNVGRNTTLHIDQTAGTQGDGNNNWIALNQVVAGTSPSVIQGQIKAEGTVYLINQNGVLFDAGSQVNVHSLLASTLPLYLGSDASSLILANAQARTASAQRFLTSGIGDPTNNTDQLAALGSPASPSNAALSTSALPGNITINAGAKITGGSNGYVLLAAPNVDNAGWISISDGQVAIAAGRGVTLNTSSSGIGFNLDVNAGLNDSAQARTSRAGRISNRGLITSARGNVVLQGIGIEQAGVIEATTSVSAIGGITLKAQDTVGANTRYGSLILRSGSVTAVLPDDSGQPTNSTQASTTNFYNALTGVSLSGGAVTLEGATNTAAGALIEAPGQPVKISTPEVIANDTPQYFPLPASQIAGRVYVDTGAIIDVSGLADIQKPLSDVLVKVARVGQNELADSPLQRSGPVFGASVTIDSRITGTRDDGVSWVGTPLANLIGYVQAVTRTASELLTAAGSIALSGREVIARSGSELNLRSGYVHYLGGYLTTTHLLAANGAVVDIASADPNTQYIGFAGETVVNQSRWNVTTRYANPLLASMLSSTYQPDDVVGGAAGTLSITGSAVALVASTVDLHAVSGVLQTEHRTQPVGGTVIYTAASPFASGGYGSSFVLTSVAAEKYLPSTFSASDTLPARDPQHYDASYRELGWWTPVSTQVYGDSGIGKLIVKADKLGATTLGGEVLVESGVSLAVTPGGSIQLTGSRVTVDGALVARAGSIKLEATGQTAVYDSNDEDPDGPAVSKPGTTVWARGVDAGAYLSGDITVGADAVLDTSGLFVNDAGKDAQNITGFAYINGGAISLVTDSASLSIGSRVSTPAQELNAPDPLADAYNPLGLLDDNGEPAYNIPDLTGSINLSTGSRVTANSGAYVAQNGQLRQQSRVVAGSTVTVIAGRGGDIALQTYVGNFGGADQPAVPVNYVASSSDPTTGTKQVGLPSTAGQIRMQGVLSSYGFTSGGQLSIRAPGIQIGGAGTSAAVNPLVLGASFFTDHGFGSFDLKSVYDATIGAGTDLSLQQRNLLPVLSGGLLTAASGTELFGSDGQPDSTLLKLTTLDSYHRTPVNFSLQTGYYLQWPYSIKDVTIDGNQTQVLVPPDLSSVGITGSLLVASGARIDADAGASVLLGAVNQLTMLGAISAPGGKVTLTVDTSLGGYAQIAGWSGSSYSSDSKSIWLGPTASIDVSGVTIINTTDPAPSGVPLGRVLDGGDVIITADSGYILAPNCSDVSCSTAPKSSAQATAASTLTLPTYTAAFSDNTGSTGTGGSSGGGSSGGGSSGGTTGGNSSGSSTSGGGVLIDVSGTQGTIGVLYACTRDPQPTVIASDAGSITLASSSGLYFHGRLKGQAGGLSAQGASLNIVPLSGKIEDYLTGKIPSATALLISATPKAFPSAAVAPGVAPLSRTSSDGTTDTSPDGVLYFESSLLTDSGITTLRLGNDPTLNANVLPVPISFTSSVTLDLARELTINTLHLNAAPSKATSKLTIELDAPYIALHGYAAPAAYSTDPNAWEYSTTDDNDLPVYSYARINGSLTSKWTDIAKSVLTFNANTLDLGGQVSLDYYKTVNMNADADIRFYLPPAYSQIATSTGDYLSVPTLLRVSSDLNMSAARIYPATANRAIIIADNAYQYGIATGLVDGDGNKVYNPVLVPSVAAITFSRSGSANPATPLSVGGTLIVDATTIVQNGALFAPGGQIILGLTTDAVNDPTARTLTAYAASPSELHYILPDGSAINPDGVNFTSVDIDETPATTDADGNGKTKFKFSKPVLSGSDIVINLDGTDLEEYDGSGEQDEGFYYKLLNPDNYTSRLFQIVNQKGVVQKLTEDNSLELTYSTPVLPALAVLRSDGATVQEAFLRTKSVEFGGSSLTSVSLNGLSIPYGTTVDGKNPVYNGTGDANANIAALTQAPLKNVTAIGAKVSVDDGAVIDLQGGGDLISSQWVAGIGGSRNLLSQYNVSYATGTAVSTPLYADARPIYAILPGYSGPAPYDPAFSSDPLIGQSVYLSGLKGLPAGKYVLLPAQFATLPGAYRLVQDTRSVAQDALATLSNQVLPDGTLQIAGYFSDSYASTRSARTTTFLVQDQATWRQYSDYEFTSLNNYFSGLADLQKTALRLPGSGGSLGVAVSSTTQLSPSATKDTITQSTITTAPSFTLDGTLKAATPSGLGGAELQIAAPQLQVVSGSGSVLDGYVSFDADALNAYGLGRLVLGAVSLDGTSYSVGARSVSINTRGSALQAGEIILVSHPDSSGDGIVIGDGAKLAATGTATGRKSGAFIIPGVVDANTEDTIVDSDGSYLALSANDLTAPVRNLDADKPLGLISIGAGASLSAPGSILLDATATTAISPTAQLQTAWLTADARQITISASDTGSSSGGLFIGPTLARQLSGIGRLTLNSLGTLNFGAGASLSASTELDLNAGTFTVASGSASVSSALVRFSNALGDAVTAPASGSGVLTVSAGTIDLGSDGNIYDFNFSGLSTLNLQATQSIRSYGSQTIDLGQASLVAQTPLWSAAAGSDLQLNTLGAFSASATGASGVLANAVYGGSLRVEAATIGLNTALYAQGGTIGLTADSGDITLGSKAVLSAAGGTRAIFDTGVDVPGGQILLTSVAGKLQAQAGSLLDVSSGGSSAAGGRLNLSASTGSVELSGTIKGASTTAGRGGYFTLDSGGAVALDTLATQLLSGGFDQSINIHARQGDLLLSSGNTLKAREVTLTADTSGSSGGTLTINGRIDASGSDGGKLRLYGQRGLTLNGALDASARSASGRGGNVELGVGASGDGSLGALGQQRFTADTAGAMRFGAGSSIDVSAGVQQTESLGKLNLRLPLLADGSLPLQGAGAVQIKGTSRPVVEAYARWLATSTGSGSTPFFNGIIDPAGTSSAASASFVGTTLAGFIANPGWTLSLPDAWKARAGIELVNGNSGLNGGNITLASNWNLAAGTLDAQGNPVLQLRTAGMAPTITLRAVNDLQLKASLSDGFFQTVNPFGTALDNSQSPLATASNPLPIATATLLGRQASTGTAYDSASFRLVAGADVASAAPLGIVAQSAGSVVISGKQSYTETSKDPNPGRKFVLPTVIRTGVGSIDIAAAGKLQLSDADAPGAIYTAGYADRVGTAAIGSVLPTMSANAAPTLLAPQTQPHGAGDITIRTGGDIVGITRVRDTDGTRTGTAGTELSQYWWPWMQDACLLQASGSTCNSGSGGTQSLINFGMFAQGVLSTGGNVSVDAGGSITDFSVSLPTSWRVSNGALVTVGGSSLNLRAAGDIRGGMYFVARGDGRISAGRDIAQSAALESTLLALQDAQLDVAAGRNARLGGLFNPSYLFRDFDSQSYSTRSSVSILAAGGDAALGTGSQSYQVMPGDQYSRTRLNIGRIDLLPASIAIAAPEGALTVQRMGELYPSATGGLTLLAKDDIVLNQSSSSVSGTFGLIDAPTSLLPSVLNPLSAISYLSYCTSVRVCSNAIANANLLFHDQSYALGLHEADTLPLRIYSAEGSLYNGAAGAFYQGAVSLFSDKPATIRTGLDIVNLNFSGQNLYKSDVTTISAGRDLYYEPVLNKAYIVPLIELGGAGTLVVEAGRDLGPLPSVTQMLAAGTLTFQNTRYPGIYTVGSANNFYLDRSGADIAVRFGVAPGMQVDAFASRYLDPAVLHDPSNLADPIGTPDYSALLIAFVQQYLVDQARRSGSAAPAKPTAVQAWTVFKQMPLDQRKLLVGDVLLKILNQVGLDYNSSTSRFAGKYLRGYQAIETLYPGSLGYSQNVLDGTSNGAKSVKVTGTFDMRGSTVQTQSDGDISIIGPGGRVLVGSTSAPPTVNADQARNLGAVLPNNQGILTLRAGAIGMFTDQSVLLAQSRIFTEQGGDLLIWSSNGDINAGKGAKTSSEIPPIQYSCDFDLFCIADAGSQVSGAGIAVLQSKPGAPSGSANLVAPAGTVDAGDAGIRVAGSLNVAAAQVANASNIQVGGAKIGVPTGAVNTGAVAAASSVAASAAQSADQVQEDRKRRKQDLELFVDVLQPPEGG